MTLTEQCGEIIKARGLIHVNFGSCNHPHLFGELIHIVSESTVTHPSELFAQLAPRFRRIYAALGSALRIAPEPLAVEDERLSTDSPDRMREWMTEFDGLPSLEVPDDAVRERLILRVESTLGRRFVMYMFPAKITASAERRLVQ